MYVDQDADIPAGQAERIEAQCPSGDVPVGGGYNLIPNGGPLPPVQIGYDVPYQSVSIGASIVYTRGWTVYFENTDPVNRYQVTVNASCVPLSGDTSVQFNN